MDDDIPDSMPPEERRTRRHFERHRLTFVLGFLPIVFGMFLGRMRWAAVILFAFSGLLWVVSGVSAIACKRHMFSGVSGGGAGFVKVRPSGNAPIAARVIGVVLVLLGLGLFNVAFQIAMAR